MKIAIATAAAMLAASSFAFAANNDGGDRGSRDGVDRSTTGSIERDRNDIDDQERCRNHEWGGPLCGEMGIDTQGHQ